MIDARVERKSSDAKNPDIPQVNASAEQEAKIMARMNKRLGEIHGRR